ncbi:MAG TPA: histidine ammonia-lyase [Thermoplasmata archaeon]|nr:histidine ammonia-lyase [Thermoplasmata archaeon]
MTETLPLDGRSLSLDQFLAVVRQGCGVSILPESLAAVAASRRAVERAVASGRAVYGVTTGFGALSDRTIPADRLRELQLSLVRSHAAGAGPPLARDVARGLVLLRVNSLLRGVSGVRPELVERLVEILNRGLVPWIPEQGSVGASGDLAPLAHLALALIGEGAFLRPRSAEPEPARDVLAREGLAPFALVEKEGVALLNGTSLMASYLALAVADARTLLGAATVAAALSFDALEGNPESLDDRLGEVRNAPEQRATATAMRSLLERSELAAPRTGWVGQDPYTLRCIPQVLGAARLGTDLAGVVATRELNAVTDNPLVFEGDQFVSGGNFHGQPLAFALDSLALSVQYIAGFSERRTSRLLHPALNHGLPPFLSPDPGVSSGFMILQYLAAALVNENATLVHPASATSLPTSADQEDYVSMGAWAGAKLLRLLENARRVVAVEWIVAGQALELRRPRSGGRGSQSAVRALRSRVEPWTRDRSPSADVAAVAEAIASGALLAEVRATVPF